MHQYKLEVLLMFMYAHEIIYESCEENTFNFFFFVCVSSFAMHCISFFSHSFNFQVRAHYYCYICCMNGICNISTNYENIKREYYYGIFLCFIYLLYRAVVQNAIFANLQTFFPPALLNFFTFFIRFLILFYVIS